MTKYPHSILHIKNPSNISKTYSHPLIHTLQSTIQILLSASQSMENHNTEILDEQIPSNACVFPEVIPIKVAETIIIENSKNIRIKKKIIKAKTRDIYSNEIILDIEPQTKETKSNDEK